MNLKDFGKPLPYPIKQGLKYIYGTIPPRFRYSKVFWETYNFLQKSQWCSRDKLEEYQFQKLKELLLLCSKYVPFYQRKWADWGIDIKMIKDFSDFSRLPFTTKEDIKRFGDSMIPIIFDRKRLILTYTGGTTGSRANFYNTVEATERELAFLVLYWSWHGCNYFKDKMGFLGSSYEFKEKIEKSGAQYFLPTWNLSESSLVEYIKFINSKKITFIRGYPSIIYELFKSAKRCRLPLHVKKVFFASEKIYDYQKEFIQKYFDVSVYCHYGQQERVALFLECPFEEGYHIISHYGYPQFESVNGQLYEIISTGFLNLATPLIRYKTQDYAILRNDKKCICEREYPKVVEDIAGRTGDMIITASGKIIGPNHLQYAIRYIEHIKDCQIVQDDFDHLKVLIVPDKNFTKEEEKAFKKAILWRLMDEMEIDIQSVENIERPFNSKKRFTINLTTVTTDSGNKNKL